MSFPMNHKTVFLLDHNPFFATSSQSPIEFDFNKSRGPSGVIPLSPITKSLWTCSVEAAIEYCRIVWDIYPLGKLIRFVVCDTEVETLNSWSTQQQSVSHLLGSLANVGAPTLSGPDNILHGLRTAIEVLSQCTEVQHERRTSVTIDNKVMNRGRVLCLTRIRDNIHLHSIKEYFLTNLTQQNRLASGSDHLLVINECELVLIDVHALGRESRVGSLPRDESSACSIEVHSASGGVGIPCKLSALAMVHFDLASTTVTGIPMKEEQNASSSANYDVEILHPSLAHSGWLKANADDLLHVISTKEGKDYQTITLKWCTPRSGSTVELHHCSQVHRITPVDVNSRPSSCLTNFLLGGRWVLLELCKKSGGKSTSHMLAAHGGEIYIHTLGTGRSILEDPPSISEGCGGRITDYRIPDFCTMMKANKLRPHASGLDEQPLDAARAQLKRHTAYWPLTLSSTHIYNTQGVLDTLFRLMPRETLTDEDMLECKKVIFNLMSMEAKGEPLTLQVVGQRGKGPKREEQYRSMWTELETFLRSHCWSSAHKRVYECLLECRNKNPAEEKGVELDQALRVLDRMGGKDKKRTATANGREVESKRRMLPSNLGLSLLSLWGSRMGANNTKSAFAGLIDAANGTAKLYAGLTSTEKDKE